MLSRLFADRWGTGISHTEAGVMHALSQHPRRITELATGEGLSQPAITLLINRLQERGWVQRAHDPSDRRAVLVKLTELGAGAFRTLRDQYRELVYGELAALADSEVQTLADAGRILDNMVERLRRELAP